MTSPTSNNSLLDDGFDRFLIVVDDKRLLVLNAIRTGHTGQCFELGVIGVEKIDLISLSDMIIRCKRIDLFFRFRLEKNMSSTRFD